MNESTKALVDEILGDTEQKANDRKNIRKKYTLKPTRPVAFACLGFVAAGLYVLIAISVGSAIWMFCKAHVLNYNAFISIGVAVFLLVLMNYGFDWFKSVEVSFKKSGMIFCEEFGLLSMNGVSSYRYTVEEITAIQHTKRNITVQGTITYMDAWGRKHPQKKLVLKGDAEDRDSLIEELKGCVKK